MSSKQKWRVNIRNLEATIRIGIHAHEQKPQRVIINAAIEGMYPAAPAGINECFNYDPVIELVARQWPKRPHVDLLETYVTELLTFIFRMDDRVAFARASVCKPDIFAEAESVGVEAEWARADFERLAKQ